MADRQGWLLSERVATNELWDRCNRPSAWRPGGCWGVRRRFGGGIGREWARDDGGASPTLLLEELLEGQGAVVLLVLGGVDEGDGAGFGFLAQEGEGFFVGFEFFPVAGLELLPPGRVVGEPFAEFGAGGDVFEPEVDGRLGLGQAAGPEALDEDALAIIFGGLFVRSFDVKHNRPLESRKSFLII